MRAEPGQWAWWPSPVGLGGPNRIVESWLEGSRGDASLARESTDAHSITSRAPVFSRHLPARVHNVPSILSGFPRVLHPNVGYRAQWHWHLYLPMRYFERA